MKKRIINITGTILMFVALIFTAKKFIELGLDFSLFMRPRILLLTAGLLVVQLTSLLLLAYAWRLILGYYVKPLPDIHKVICVYFKSNIMKYLPGNVGQYVGRQVFGISLGMTQAQLALSSFLEVGFTVLSVFIIALIFGGDKVIEVYDTLHPNDSYILIVIGIGILFVAAILLMTFRKHRTIIMVLELFKERNFWLRSLTILSLYTVQFLVFNLVFALLVQLNIQISTADIFIIIAASAISWFVGFITPGVPGGVGIRESVLLLMLPMYPQEAILSAAIVQRVIMIIGDVLGYLFSTQVVHIRSRER